MSARDEIEEIKRRLDIVDVIREYIPNLKKSGRNHFGLCPFHNEDTPSFSVNSELGIYKCFGCGESGDVIKFIEKMEGVDFPKALELTAKRSGVKLTRRFSPEQSKAQKERTRIYEVNKLAMQFFHHVLMTLKQGRPGLEYAKARGLRKKELETFMIGFAPSGFENLKRFLLARGFNQDELTRWGLLVSKNGRVYDKFRNRLMFPIFDHLGDVAGFSGRIIDKDDFGPKYLNSPETLVYKKSEIVYGLFQAKESVRKNDFVVMVEGNVDILSSHSKGVKNIVAPLGTSVTEQQLRILKRYGETIYFALDSDQAGEKALFRALDTAEQLDVKSRAIDLEGMQDADEYIVAGKDWKKAVADAEPIIDHLIKRLAKRMDLDSATGKAQFAETVLQFISKLGSAIEKAHYLQRLSETIKVEPDVLKRELGRFNVRTKSKGAGSQPASQFTKQKISNGDYLLAYLIAHPEFVQSLDPKEFDGLYSQECAKILKLVLTTVSPEQLKEELSAAEIEIYAHLTLLNVEIQTEEDAFRRESSDLIARIRKGQIRQQIKQLKYAEVEDQDKEERLKVLIEQLAALEKSPE